MCNLLRVPIRINIFKIQFYKIRRPPLKNNSTGLLEKLAFQLQFLGVGK